MKNLLATYRRLYGYVQPFRLRYILALLITLPIGAMDGLVAWAIKPFMDQVLVLDNLEHLFWVPVAIIVVNSIQGILRYYETYLDEFLAQKVMMGIRQDMFVKLQQMEMPYFYNQGSGNIAARYFTDPSRVQRALVSTLRVLLTKSITTVALVCVMFYHSWNLSLVAISILSLIIFPIVHIRKRLTELAHQEAESSSRLITLLNETFYGIKTLLSFRAFGYQNQRFDAAQQDNYHQVMKMAQIKGFMAPITNIISAVGIGLIVWYGSYLVIMDELTIGALLSFIVAMVMLYRPIKGLGTSVVDGQKALASADRIFEILDSPKILNANPGTYPFSHLETAIEYKDVYFRYDNQSDWVLKGVSLTLHRGETVAVVGGSGAGKTTLVELLMGFYPDFSGDLLLDRIKLQAYESHSLMRGVAYVSQDTQLFEGSLFENILLGKLNATQQEVMEAVRKAHLWDFVEHLPQGLNTLIGERGVKLSGGQRQRVAIARAILKNAPILILDEATSALDNESEAYIRQALSELIQNRTVLIIAHRLSTIQSADRIVVMDQGQIVEEGTHEHLLTRVDGSYNRLYSAQFNPNIPTFVITGIS